MNRYGYYEKESLRPYPDALLNPCADPTFKALFTQETPESHKALEGFLTAMLGKKVTNTVHQPNELLDGSPSEKQTRFDFTCVIEDIGTVNIEMQGINSENSYDMRAEYLVSHLLNHYVGRGSKWKEVPKVYQISVLNFIYDKNDSNGYSHYKMTKENGGRLRDRLNIIFLELPKFTDKRNGEIQKLTSVEKWSKFFLYAQNPDKNEVIKEMALNDEGIKNAESVLIDISRNDSAWIAETQYWTAISDERTIRANAEEKGFNTGLERGMKEGLEKGLEQGLEQGLKQGHEQGLEQGLKQGHEQGLKQGHEQGKRDAVKNVVQNAIKNNLSVDIIQTITGLSKEEIEKIANEK